MRARHILYGKLVIVISLTFIFGIVKCQKASTDIRNVTIDIYDNSVIIYYDIANYNPGQQFNIGIYFLDDDGRPFYPQSISGDVGGDIQSGNAKSIVWDISNDIDELNFLLRPQFIINGMRKGANLGGPNNAFFSMILPGLGDYFVENTKEQMIKPYIKTASFLTLMGLGFKALSVRGKETILVNTGRIAQEIDYYYLNGRPHYVDMFDELGQPIYIFTEQSRTNIWLFNGDYELFFAAAGTLWLLDVIYVSNRGKKNIDARDYFRQQNMLQLGFNSHGVSLKYTF